jgi:hypothetical protein
MIERDVDLVHVGMGVAMAGMLPRLNPLAGGGWTFGWTVFFAFFACWFGARTLIAVAQSGKVGHKLAHLLASGVMLYMLDGMPGTGSMPGMAGVSAMPGMAVGSPIAASALTVLLLIALGGNAVLATGRPARGGWVLVAATGSTGTGGGGIGLPLAPRLAVCCEIAMSVTMGYLLLLVL